MRVIGKFHNCVDVTEYRAAGFMFQIERREWEGDNMHRLCVFDDDGSDHDALFYIDRVGPAARQRCIAFIQQIFLA